MPDRSNDKPRRVGLRTLIAFLGAAVGSVSSTNAVSDTRAALGIVPEYGLDLVAYATVRRIDGSYRRMLIDPKVLARVAETGTVPDGTRILMETYYSPGQRSTVFHSMKRAGRWLYGSFNQSTDLAVRSQASCLTCHARAAETDFVFTLPSVKAAAEGLGTSDFQCDRGGRSPCGAEIYAEGAAR
ncbi:MAG: cytochrome P460 family protein [Pseudomonadota bacterium]